MLPRPPVPHYEAGSGERAEIITFRSPEGIGRQGDGPKDNPKKTFWHSCALFLSDNIATQIDGLGHITTGPDHH